MTALPDGRGLVFGALPSLMHSIAPCHTQKSARVSFLGTPICSAHWVQASHIFGGSLRAVGGGAGGLDGEGKYRNDAFVVDAKRISWFGLAGIMKGAPPKPRAYHRCAQSLSL